MKFLFDHNNINVSDLQKSLDFYKKNLNLTEARRKESDNYIIVFLKDEGNSDHRLELTYLKNQKTPYNLGDNEIHLALRVDDFNAALSFHKENDVVVYENKDMGIYFIADPDGYWTEVVPYKAVGR